MKKSILAISLMTVAMAVFAIDYPTYKPTTPTYGGGGSTSNGGDDNTTYGGYSTTTSGGVTTYGEGAATGPARGPRRTTIPGSGWGSGYDKYGFPIGASEGDVFTDDSGTYIYSETKGWVESSSYFYPGDVDPSPEPPVGSPWIMLLFAAMAAAVVAFRRRKAMAVVALLLVCGQGWAYTFGPGEGNVTAIWGQGESFTLVFVDNTKAFGFQNAGGVPGFTDVSTTSVVITFSSETTWQRTNSNLDVFHWRLGNNTWHHNNQEWYKFSTKGKKTATNEFPIPDRTGYTTLTITLDGSGNSVFTWSGGSAPAPSGDHKIDGCDGCFLVEE